MKLAFIRYKPSIFRYKEVRGHLAIFSVKYRIYFQTKMGPCPIQLVVLRAVIAAVRTDTASWSIVFQVCLFFIIVKIIKLIFFANALQGH